MRDAMLKLLENAKRTDGQKHIRRMIKRAAQSTAPVNPYLEFKAARAKWRKAVFGE